MEKDELKKLLSEVGAEHRAQIKTEVQQAVAASLVDDKLKAEAIKEMTERVEALGLKENVIKDLTSAIEKQGEEMRKFNANQEKKEESLESFIEKKAEEIKKVAEFRSTDSKKAFSLKIPRNVVTKTQVNRGGVVSSTMAMRLAEVGHLAYRGLKMSEIFQHFPVDPSSNGMIRYYDQATVGRSAAPTTEGSNAPESATTWIERFLPIPKIMDSIPVTKEAFKDVYFIASEIERLLNVNLAIKEDQQLWGGTGIAPQLTGISTSAQVFDATNNTNFGYVYSPAGGGTGVYKANIFDLIKTVRVAIINAINADGSYGKQGKYDPDIVVMNPADVLTYQLSKDQFGRYLFENEVGAEIGAMRLVESSVVSQGSLLVGDSRYARIYDLDPVTVEMGYINAQFVQDAMTLLAEKREALLCRVVDSDGFAYVSNINTQIGAINSVTI